MSPITPLPTYRKFPIIKVVLLILALFLIFLIWTIEPPRHYPVGKILEVPTGLGLYQLGEKLESEHIIRSPFWFRNIAILLGGERRMKAGQYYLDHSQTVPVLVWRIVTGDYKIETEKITVPEGFSNEKISQLFPDETFGYFDNGRFLREAEQGYLFPDTYFIPVTATATSTIKLMRDNFDEKIATVSDQIKNTGKTLKDIIIMASLIEAETNNQTDREMVSGILWKRLKIGMALQVDVEMKTYEYPGLPNEPINNPGLLSIKASINPTSTPYLYYITGNDGKMHYAKTFEEHEANIAKYLKR